MPTANEILKEHVTLDIECIDRLYLNGYIPNLQVGGQLVSYLHHLGYPIPSPAILNRLTNDSTYAVKYEFDRAGPFKGVGGLAPARVTYSCNRSLTSPNVSFGSSLS